MNKEMFATGARILGWIGLVIAGGFAGVATVVLMQPGNADDREALAKAAIYQQLQQQQKGANK